ncbi:predicted protein [Uncinocarpus reesii 1704]|uniref:Uncharacterized protein n=1 Tax=Uncinocarpus reesii (strain UAMH 1704) TaxID=336963 RepID=C4JF93_UNCRE|nr:uncharacterized protein UREG_02315 [Uncinocarpus reesii 1704]EEP77466.1 predicted protein [Uncinocarpus reesii 1704]
MSDRPATTGVRSLLAKFENNISASPPSRGRSPVGADGSAAVRPLSKVRASFIPVERNGGSGSPLGWLRRTDSGDSPVNTKPPVTHEFGGPIDKFTPLSPTGSVRMNVFGKSTPSTPMTEKRDPANANSTIKHDIPSEVIQGLGAILKGSPFEDSKPPTPPKKNGSPLRELGSALPEPKATVAPATKPTSPPKEASPPTKEHAPDRKPATSRPSNLVISKESVNQGRKSAVNRGPKTPPAPRTPKLPVTPESQVAKPNAASPAITKETAKVPSRVNTPKRPGRSTFSPAAQTKHVNPNRDNASRPGSKNTSPDQPKVRHKSPTRPVRLPSSMTAPTASSAAKTSNASSRPASRNGVNVDNKAMRKPSSLRVDRAVSGPRTTAPSTTVRKQPSRAALAPPPNIGVERPKSRTSNVNARAPDESFLARMMRPTASSANKVHDKIEAKSPPRSTRTARPVRKPADKNHANSNHPPKSKSPEVAKSPVQSSPDADSATETSIPQVPQEPESQGEIVEPPVRQEEPDLPVAEEAPAAPTVEAKEPEAAEV